MTFTIFFVWNKISVISHQKIPLKFDNLQKNIYLESNLNKFMINAWYIKFSDEKIVKTIQLNDNILCDLDSNWMPVGIEFISVPKEKINTYLKNIKFINSKELVIS